jgi:hypothetical protein
MQLLNALSVPRALATFARKWLKASCLATDTVGDCVYISADYSGIRYSVTRADPRDTLKMPAVGIIISKSSPTLCKVQWSGELAGVYTGLTVNKPIFVGLDGRVTITPPGPLTGGYSFVQNLGVIVGTSRILLAPNFFMVKRVG